MKSLSSFHMKFAYLAVRTFIFCNSLFCASGFHVSTFPACGSEWPVDVDSNTWCSGVSWVALATICTTQLSQSCSTQLGWFISFAGFNPKINFQTMFILYKFRLLATNDIGSKKNLPQHS